MSRQAWAIVEKVVQVDKVLCYEQTLQCRVREVHAEVSFYCLAGKRAMQYSKKSLAGHNERRRLLEPIFGQALNDALAKKSSLGSAQDDILDAFVALWTAERIVLGLAQSI